MYQQLKFLGSYSNARHLSKGQVLVPLLVASTILAVSLVFYQSTIINMRKQTLAQSQRLVANLAVSELLEYFRSQTPAQILNYLAATPNAAQPYPLCAHINILDRTNNKIVNRDDIAALADSWLDFGSTIKIAGTSYNAMANRFYQVFVVDSSTMIPVASHCQQTANQLIAAGGLVGNEKLLVVVTLTWVPKQYSGSTLADVFQRASASVLIPGVYP